MARGSKRGGDHEGSQQRTSGADLTPDAPSFDDTDAPSFDDTDAPAIDLAAIARDDALIDAIAGDGQVATSSPEEFELATLLAAWRAEILAPAMPAEPNLDQVAAAVDRELATIAPPHRSGLRLLRPIVGVAAAVAVVMAGLTVFSYNAVPGDPLWKVKEVVFTERANSTVAGIDTTTNLEEAERLIQAGNPEAALAVLESAGKRVGDVSESAKRDELTAWRERLMADVAKTTPPATTTTTTPPSAPGTIPGLPVVPGVTLPGVSVTVPVLPTTVPTSPSLPTYPPVDTVVPPITLPPITLPPIGTIVPPVDTTIPPVETTDLPAPTTTKGEPTIEDTPTQDQTSNPPPS